jgi:glycosyltransferase involved in cell wall biosynthesis
MQTRTPLFSIVIPLYNRAHQITSTIRSVLSQTCQDFEIIVVDDGSTDNPQPIVASFDDNRIHYIRQENSGGSAARNTGVKNAAGEYIAFLDSDDTFLPHKLETIKQLIPSTKARIYFSFMQVERANGLTEIKPYRPLKQDEDVSEYLFCDNNPLQTSTLVVRADLAKILLFNTDLPKGQDLDYVLWATRIISHSKDNFFFIEQVLSTFNNKNFSSRVSQSKHADKIEKWFNKHSSFMFTEKSRAGFKGNYLSYEIAREKPLTALYYILNAYYKRAASLKRTLHSLARAFIPNSIFRNASYILLKHGIKS